MKRTGLIIVLTSLLLSFGCADDYVPYDHSLRILVFHNNLQTRVEFNIGDSPYGTRSLKPYMQFRSASWYRTFFENGPSYSDVSVFLRIYFADGRVKTDRRCDEFLLEPALYNACLQDTVSVFRLSDYQKEIEGNDTLYHYFISEKDSLEAI